MLVAFAAFTSLANGESVTEEHIQVSLPIEVVGDAGTEATVTVDIPSGRGIQIRLLKMQIHGLEFDGMASIRINQSPWQVLANDTVDIAEPGRSYGGIGGGFATLKLTLPVAAGAVVDHSNSLHFRFNRSDGVVSGFRVLSLNFLTADGREILPAAAFREDNPNAWTPPLPDAASISTGSRLWQGASLRANGLPDAPTIRAHCSDCHARDGRDLKYFNFSNRSIVARSRFHGLPEIQGWQIASYIRSLPLPNPGRPWNPPYQPGPGPDSRQPASWVAGAGLSWVLDNDIDSVPFLFPDKSHSGAAAITPDAFRPNGNLNPREIPIAMQLPDWNHWLPRIHPRDRWGQRFESSAFSRFYESRDRAPFRAEDEMRVFFDNWSNSRGRFLVARPAQSRRWSADLAQAYYSAQLWQLTKAWEIIQESGLEGAGRDTAAPEAGIWSNTIPASTAPSAVGIPDSPAGMGGSALTNEYFSGAWYELQILLNSGNHRHHGRAPIDWPYVVGHFLELERLSGRPEPARLLVTLIKSMQSSDPRLGPTNYAEGWRPDQNIDPRILVCEEWALMFAGLPEGMKRALTESFLAAWLDKTLQYPAASYFQLGGGVSRYTWPPSLRNATGGKVWEAELRFQKAGVSDELIRRMRKWGESYSAMAELFHY